MWKEPDWIWRYNLRLFRNAVSGVPSWSVIFGCHINHSDKNSTPTYCFEFVVHLDSSLVSGKKKGKVSFQVDPSMSGCLLGMYYPKHKFGTGYWFLGLMLLHFSVLGPWVMADPYYLWYISPAVQGLPIVTWKWKVNLRHPCHRVKKINEIMWKDLEPKIFGLKIPRHSILARILLHLLLQHLVWW